MKLLNLAGQVCRAFYDSHSAELRTVQKVKNEHSRDVVTALDIKLHELSEGFVKSYLPGYRLLSEEGADANWSVEMLREGNWLLVDPLDGSSNFALGLPHFGYMAVMLQNSTVEGSLIVLPEHNQYLIVDQHSLLTSQPLPTRSDPYGTVYYAYPPGQDTESRQLRVDLMELIDAESSGLYRSGSACVGLYQLLCGQHKAFFGHGVRPWDALAYLPVLAMQGMFLLYALKGTCMHLFASRRADLLESAEDIMTRKGRQLYPYKHGETLIVEEM
jgi:myo-inositol-1(or 4)-monophosphatase